MYTPGTKKDHRTQKNTMIHESFFKAPGKGTIRRNWMWNRIAISQNNITVYEYSEQLANIATQAICPGDNVVYEILDRRLRRRKTERWKARCKIISRPRRQPLQGGSGYFFSDISSTEIIQHFTSLLPGSRPNIQSSRRLDVIVPFSFLFFTTSIIVPGLSFREYVITLWIIPLLSETRHLPKAHVFERHIYSYLWRVRSIRHTSMPCYLRPPVWNSIERLRIVKSWVIQRNTFFTFNISTVLNSRCSFRWFNW